MKAMALVALSSLIVLAGCKHTNDADAATPPPSGASARVMSAPPPPSTSGGSGSGDSVHPIGSPMAGGMTPMAGGDMGSSAGSVGNAAKRQAQQMSGKAGSAETGGDEGTTG